MHRNNSAWNRLTASFCAALMVPSGVVLTAPLPTRMSSQTPTKTATQQPKISNDQLDALVAPLALYPDPLLAQVLAASTYPLEIVQLQQWLARNPNSQGEAAGGRGEKTDWEPS